MTNPTGDALKASAAQDHERIWLESLPEADPYVGRTWCEDNNWGEDATEYVRADLAALSPVEQAPQPGVPETRQLVTHIRPTVEGDSVEYAYKVCATGDDGAIPVFYGPPAHISVSDEMAERLIAAVEGELDGLAIDDGQALAILSYALGGPTPTEAPPVESQAAEIALQAVINEMMMQQGSANNIRQQARNVIKAYRAALAAESSAE